MMHVHNRRGLRIVHLMLLSSALLAAAAVTEPMRLKIDSTKTEVSFVLQATGHQVHGTIEVSRGEIEFDADRGTASGEIRLDLSSAITENEGRDEKMHAEVFETKKFPNLIFHADRFEGVLTSGATGKVNLYGRLEIHGESHPLLLRSEVSLLEGMLQGKTSFQIPYVAWGLKDPSVFILRVAKEVDVEVALVGRVEPVESPIAAPVDESE